MNYRRGSLTVVMLHHPPSYGEFILTDVCQSEVLGRVDDFAERTSGGDVLLSKRAEHT